MSKLYKIISEKMAEAQELLDESKRNLSDARDFVSREMIREPQLAVRKLYTDLYQIAKDTATSNCLN